MAMEERMMHMRKPKGWKPATFEPTPTPTQQPTLSGKNSRFFTMEREFGEDIDKTAAPSAAPSVAPTLSMWDKYFSHYGKDVQHVPVPTSLPTLSPTEYPTQAPTTLVTLSASEIEKEMERQFMFALPSSYR